MAYRNERDALQVHCESLRRRLAEEEAGSEELQEANEELKVTLARLGILRISDAERQVASRQLSRRAKLIVSTGRDEIRFHRLYRDPDPPTASCQ